MALDALLNEFKGINGYKASAILDFTGETLVSDSASSDIDLAVAGPTFNDIFRAAHAAAGKVGLMAASDMVIQTPGGIIVMSCTGVESKAHLHVVCILAKDGNQALVKMAMHKIGPKAMDEVA